MNKPVSTCTSMLFQTRGGGRGRICSILDQDQLASWHKRHSKFSCAIVTGILVISHDLDNLTYQLIPIKFNLALYIHLTLYRTIGSDILTQLIYATLLYFTS